MKRREFLKRSLLVSGFAGLTSLSRASEGAGSPIVTGEKPLIVSTWGFGKPANDAALRVLQAGGSILDAIEQGIWVPEADPQNPSVGLGGAPNAAGVVQLDACIMSGPDHRAGSVAALEGIRHPISAARRVMEKTPHVMLVGEGARKFALEQGLEAALPQPRAPRTKTTAARVGKDNHDTIALLVLGANGDLAGGCSTSGLARKLPGRVGDSPIVGGGIYVDNEVGAAGATGLGENIMRYCGSFLVVELMRQGRTPAAACLEAIRRIIRSEPAGSELSISFVALDKHGRYGAASSEKGFRYAVTTPTESRLLIAAGAAGKPGGPAPSHR
jgi:isoaspartyl peptidase/L-asparaginase-like protein (Ntn-hydrolase superfamily)